MDEYKVAIKSFKSLTVNELYTILQLRSEIFVLEQNCLYQDIDDRDKKAIHVMLKHKRKVVAYARFFAPGDYFKDAAIGRVLVANKHRYLGLGHKLLQVVIEAIKERFKTDEIKISAQQYLIEFYASHDFIPVGEGYLEDGIPHITMFRGNEEQITIETE